MSLTVRVNQWNHLITMILHVITQRPHHHRSPHLIEGSISHCRISREQCSLLDTAERASWDTEAKYEERLCSREDISWVILFWSSFPSPHISDSAKICAESFRCRLYIGAGQFTFVSHLFLIILIFHF